MINFSIIDIVIRNNSSVIPAVSTSTSRTENATTPKKEATNSMPEELFVPGAVYYLKRNVDTQSSNRYSGVTEFFTLWKRHPGEHFQRIVLSSNLITDHKCDSHFYALRDVLKGLPGSDIEGIFR